MDDFTIYCKVSSHVAGRSIDEADRFVVETNGNVLVVRIGHVDNRVVTSYINALGDLVGALVGVDT